MQSNPNPQNTPRSQAALPPLQKKSLNTSVIIVLIVSAVLLLGVLLLAGGVGGFYFYTQHYYGQAETSIAREDYKTAVDDLGRVVVFYKDSQKMMRYAQAGQALQDGNFYGAKQLLDGLTGYRDADVLAREADYQQAKAMLDSGDFAGAKALLDPLSAQGYKDSASLADEASYNVALSSYKAKKYTDALKRFLALHGYRDSADYAFLAKMLLRQYGSTQYSAMEANYKRLASLAGIDGAMEALESDAFIKYLLEGNWKSSSLGSDGWYFTMTHKGPQDDWNISYNMPWIAGTYFKIENCVCSLGSDADGWKENFRFTFTSVDEMFVYCCKDGSKHILKRQN